MRRRSLGNHGCSDEVEVEFEASGLVGEVTQGMTIRKHRHHQYDSLELVFLHSVFGYTMCVLQEMPLGESRVSPEIAEFHITSTIDGSRIEILERVTA